MRPELVALEQQSPRRALSDGWPGVRSSGDVALRSLEDQAMTHPTATAQPSERSSGPKAASAPTKVGSTRVMQARAVAKGRVEDEDSPGTGDSSEEEEEVSEEEEARAGKKGRAAKAQGASKGGAGKARGGRKGGGGTASSAIDADLAHLDIKKARRIMANRESAAKSKERKAQYSATLEARLGEMHGEREELRKRIHDLRADNTALCKYKAEVEVQVKALHMQLSEGLDKNRRLGDHIFSLQSMLGLERRLPQVPNHASLTPAASGAKPIQDLPTLRAPPRSTGALGIEARSSGMPTMPPGFSGGMPLLQGACEGLGSVLGEMPPLQLPEVPLLAVPQGPVSGQGTGTRVASGSAGVGPPKGEGSSAAFDVSGMSAGGGMTVSGGAAGAGLGASDRAASGVGVRAAGVGPGRVGPGSMLVGSVGAGGMPIAPHAPPTEAAVSSHLISRSMPGQMYGGPGPGPHTGMPHHSHIVSDKRGLLQPLSGEAHLSDGVGVGDAPGARFGPGMGMSMIGSFGGASGHPGGLNQRYPDSGAGSDLYQNAPGPAAAPGGLAAAGGGYAGMQGQGRGVNGGVGWERGHVAPAGGGGRPPMKPGLLSLMVHQQQEGGAGVAEASSGAAVLTQQAFAQEPPPPPPLQQQLQQLQLFQMQQQALWGLSAASNQQQHTAGQQQSAGSLGHTAASGHLWQPHPSPSYQPAKPGP